MKHQKNGAFFLAFLYYKSIICNVNLIDINGDEIMTLFQKIIMFLQRDMEPPKPWDEYHFLWIGLIIIACVSLFKIKKKDSELQLKVVLGTYGIIALLLEIAKQISWSCEIDPTTFEMTWDYTWYAAPFQLCTTPIYISLTCLFLKKSKF